LRFVGKGGGKIEFHRAGVEAGVAGFVGVATRGRFFINDSVRVLFFF